MAAYLVAFIDVTDIELYREYIKLTPAIVSKYDGKFIVRGGEVVTLEGQQENRRVVILEFPSKERIQEFYNSEEYTEAKKLRQRASDGWALQIDGV